MALFHSPTRATTGQPLTALVSLDDVSGPRVADATAASDDGDKDKCHYPSETSDVDTGLSTAGPPIATAGPVDTEVPDGGYGWTVVAGCATLTFWFGGTTYSWGVMQTALINQGLASASTLSFVGM